MLIFNPTSVRFGETPLPGVTLLSVDRRPAAGGTNIVHSQEGPWPVWADITAAITTIKIVTPLTDPSLRNPSNSAALAADLLGLVPGQLESLTFSASPQAAGKPATFTAQCMVTTIVHDLTPGTATRTVTLLALATNPDQDPITTVTL